MTEDDVRHFDPPPPMWAVILYRIKGRRTGPHSPGLGGRRLWACSQARTGSRDCSYLQAIGVPPDVVSQQIWAG